MVTVLVTGSSGFIGSRLLRVLQKEYAVMGMARSTPNEDPEIVCVQGAFHSFEDLRKLDAHDINVLVHLAAVTGGCSEEEGIAINVAGTRRLVRYLLDRGCRKFVLASSIAAPGVLGDRFVPCQVPIPATHPCLAADAYGLSKWLMEEMTRYFARSHGDADFVNLRFGAVVDDETYEPKLVDAANLKWPFLQLGRVVCSDVLQAVKLAIEAPHHPGERTYNVVGPDASACAEPVAQALRIALGERGEALDFSYYEKPGNAYAPIFEIDTIRNNLGYDPKKSTRPRETPLA